MSIIKTIATTDLCDQFEHEIHAGLIHILPPVFQAYGQKASFYGQAVTFKVFEDNTLIKKALENDNGADKVMVIDGGASVRCALVGGNIAKAGTDNGWEGILVDSCVRDTGEINELNIGVRALGAGRLFVRRHIRWHGRNHCAKHQCTPYLPPQRRALV